MRMILEKPATRRWFIDELKVTDLHDGAPTVQQLHDNPVTASTSVAQYLHGDFNSEKAYPDAVVTVGSHQILVHKHVVAKACKVLARRWDPLWSASSDPVAMDKNLCCEACTLHPSYSTALLFLEYFYTGGVTWPHGQVDMGCALELLVMACMCDVQHLVCIAEMALQSMLDTDNCCNILVVADHHQALQLRARCMHMIRKGQHMIKTSGKYDILSEDLQAEVQEGM